MEESPQGLLSADVDHLRLLALFYRIATWLFGLGTCFGIPHTVMGALMVSGEIPTKSGPNGMPDFMGYVFMFVGIAIILVGAAIAVFCHLASRWAEERSHYGHIFALACILCFGGMIGIPLGVFTLVVLCRPQVKAAFARP